MRGGERGTRREEAVRDENGTQGTHEERVVLQMQRRRTDTDNRDCDR